MIKHYLKSSAGRMHTDNITVVKDPAASLVHASGNTDEYRLFLTWFRWSDLSRSMYFYFRIYMKC